MSDRSALRYRAEIDGLRAIAVLSVVLFHAGFGCPGGYVGVDVFFVISGYLITSLVWNDLESGSFTFVGFWERRARRIVPALVVVTLASMFAGWYLLLPADFRSLGRAAASQAVFAANIHYWLDSGYFTPAAEEKPLLHTWSLALEEQFYLVSPFLLFALFHAAPRRRREILDGLIIVGILLSLAMSIYVLACYPSAAFFLLPTRAWELLLGSFVALVPVVPAIVNTRSWREALSVLGAASILIPVFVYTSDTPFPGLAALPPCVGAALLIWSNGRGEKAAPTGIGAILSQRPIAFIGLISYSLYLWHWPVLAYSKYLSLDPPSFGQRLIALCLGFALAFLSWKYVETPFRVRRWGASKASMLAIAGGGLFVVFGGGILCRVMQGFPNRLNSQEIAFASAGSDRPGFKDVTLDDLNAGKLISIGTPDPARRPAVFVWGDSHARSAIPAFDALLKESNISGEAATRSATAPVLDWGFSARSFERELAIAHNDGVLTHIQRQRFSDVFLIAYWSAYKQDNGKYSDCFKRSLVRTVQRLAAIGSFPTVLLDVPSHSFNPPKALVRFGGSEPGVLSICVRPTERNILDGFEPTFITEIEAAGGRVLDPKPQFLDPSGQRYVVQADGICLYFDGNHLTTKGANLMLLPFLRKSFSSEE